MSLYVQHRPKNCEILWHSRKKQFLKKILTALNKEYPGMIFVSTGGTGGDLTIQPSQSTSEMAGKASILLFLSKVFH